ncbi:isochorismatase family protein [Gordonia McavH-238-E]|uniref:isochorismatase family protein n=1 Tax=Gordonia sp. McavH-238-E TaxID=2917736 RepID=UPI001EF4C3D7|nr:isochorismatase family protein [Gordonia sp. McavH-238-E]MCG7632943.1 isochorismatase family protein [Gordonia sp. McavH-238-E]
MPAPKRALIVIDVQNDYFAGPMQVQYPPRDDSLNNIIAAIDAATAAGLPVVALQHTFPADFPVFADGSDGWKLHPQVQERVSPEWKMATKQTGSVFGGTDVVQWLSAKGVDTITLVGYMTNNCVIATAAHAETLGLAVEVLSDSTGAINLANEAGSVSAEQLHTTLMVLLNSNFAAVGTTAAWGDALTASTPLGKDNLVASAVAGAQAYS